MDPYYETLTKQAKTLEIGPEPGTGILTKYPSYASVGSLGDGNFLQ